MFHLVLHAGRQAWQGAVTTDLDRSRVGVVFGNVESHGGGAVADPGRPVVRIHGTAIFGNVEVHTRLPGESEHDARKRKRRERKQLAAANRLALPERSDK